jgi:eukaryotic-like serine/threonine-protein kinase
MDSPNTSGPTADGSDPQTRGVSGEMPTRNESRHVDRDASRSKPGDRVGPYTLLELIGEGGFGTVWLAERREPMVQRVAIKIIKPGMDSKAVVARFDQERQALAVMDHPNVAKVFDGGVTERGLPYFVMEHVAGQPITNFCDRHRYTIRQRLELFISVCDAVQHAHMKGIIHRDIKPSNVLAEMLDGKPVVKVIDFGIAKAMDASEVQNSVFSMEGQLIGTPEYMSPEQAGGRADIDTRTDVYSLGVMLYELLVGRLPFDPATLRQRGMDEIRRIIREDDPPRPSTRLSTIGAEGSTIALSRHHRSPATLIRELRRELEWIPLKAMRKERDRRYDSAAAFGDDVRRYLDGRALRAAPESRVYLAKKFVSRNRVPVAAAAAVFLALVTGLAGTIWQAREAERQRDFAERRLQIAQGFGEFLSQDILLAATPEDQGIDVPMSSVLQEAAHRSKERRDLPEVEAEIRLAIGQALDRLGRLPEAEDHLKAAVTLRADRSEFFGDEKVEEARLALANVLCRQDKAEESIAQATLVFDARSKRLGADDDLTLTAQNDLGNTLKYLKRFDEADAKYSDCLARRKRVFGADHAETLTVQFNQALLRTRQAAAIRTTDPAKADLLLADGMAMMRDTAERRERTLGAGHAHTLFAQSELASLLHRSGKLDQAEPLYRSLQPRMDATLGAGSWRSLQNKANLGALLSRTGKSAEALTLLREAAIGYRTARGPTGEDTVAIGAAYARLEAKTGSKDAALQFAKETYEALASELGGDEKTTRDQADLVLTILETIPGTEAERDVWRPRGSPKP